MTPWEVMGIDDRAVLTHDELRRAYLRKLRAHPPERDPEGFQRLREAYEALLAYESDDEPAIVAAAPAATPEDTIGTIANRALDALEADDLDGAHAIVAARNRQLDDSLAVTSGEVRRWALTRELLAISAIHPRTVVRALARAIRADDLSLAVPAIEAYRSRAGEDVSAILSDLRRRAPSLHKVVAATFANIRRQRRFLGPKQPLALIARDFVVRVARPIAIVLAIVLALWLLETLS